MKVKLLSLLLIGLSAAPALAQQPVLFKAMKDHPARDVIMRRLSFSGETPNAGNLTIADIDLNGDGLNEAIVRYPDQSLLIVALPPRRGMITLGRLAAARDIQVLDAQDYGVRRLITSGSNTSDFARITYQWNPRAQRYEAAP